MSSRLTLERTLARMGSLAWGVDLSHHQGSAGLDDELVDEVEFDELADAGCRFVILKATEGRVYRDPQWPRSAAALVERGVEGLDADHGIACVGSYHYTRIDSDADSPDDARIEADDHVRALESIPGWLDLPGRPWGDFEWHGSLDPKHTFDAVRRNIDWSVAWAERVDELLGREAGIYTGINVWRGRFGSTPAHLHRPLWAARYIDPPGRAPTIPVGDDKQPWRPIIHQWTGDGTLPGVRRRVDVNVVQHPDPAAALRTIAGAPARSQLRPRDWLARLLPPRLPTLRLVQGTQGPLVASAQGLLLARGEAPEGLTNAQGQPDGKLGPRTLAALERHLGPRAEIEARGWLDLLNGKDDDP